jgi:hypothetical protein
MGKINKNASKNGNKYANKNAKRPKNIPKLNQKYQMDTKFTKIFHTKAFKNIPKSAFFE